MPKVYSVFNVGTKTGIGPSGVTMVNFDYPLDAGVEILAQSGNVANVFLGNSQVSATEGFPILPGASLFMPVDNLNKIYVFSPSVNQTVFWEAF